MKKTLIIAATLMATAIGSFAQGNIIFSGTLREVWNTTNSAAPLSSWPAAGSFYVTLVFSTGTPTSGLNAISSTGSATNGTTVYTTSAAWAGINSDLSGTFFQVSGTNGLALVANATTTTGTWAYNNNTFWAAANLTAGTTYTGYEVAWFNNGGAYTTLAQASAANAWVGWSQAFSYTPTSGATTPVTLNATVAGYYGVGGLPVPEPSTLVLAGLGGLSLLAFRRKK